MKERKEIAASSGRDLFLNRYLSCFTRETEALIHSVIGGAFKNMEMADKQDCQEYFQYVAEVGECIAGMLTEIREGFCGLQRTEWQDIGQIGIREFIADVMKEIRQLCEGSVLYILTEVAVKHAVVLGDRDFLFHLFADAIMHFIDYAGAEGKVYIRMAEVCGAGEQPVYHFCVRKEQCSLPVNAGCDEEQNEGKQKTRAFYLGMEQICRQLQKCGGKILMEQEGFEIVIALPAAGSCEAGLMESRLYHMKETSKSSQMDEGIELTAIRSRYRRLAGKKVLLVTGENYAIPLQAMFGMAGIRAETASGAGDVIQRLWWSENSEFAGIVAEHGKKGVDGVYLLRRIREMEREDVWRMPVILIGCAPAECGERAVVLPADVSFEKIMEKLCIENSVYTE